MADILVVDDQKALRTNLSFYLKSQGHDVVTSESGEDAIEMIKEKYFDIVISDYKMGKITGYDLMKQIKKIRPLTEFIMITAYGNIPLAVKTVRNGAADFISKPFEYVAILERIKKLMSDRVSRKELHDKKPLEMVACSQKMKDILDLASRAASSDIAALIEGEPGTGKRMFARIVHQKSERCRDEFVTVECSNGSEMQLEQEIFGIDESDQFGALSKANSGTVFFRDIDQLPPGLQLRLLRFLREGTYFPSNSSAIRKSGARIMAASKKSLKKEVKKGAFREDLYYQLNVMPIYIPPLRARITDLGPLTSYFMGKYRAQYKKNITGISPDALTWMKSYDWPGNVQELENIISRACALATSEILDESLIFTLPQDKPEPEENIGYLNVTLKDNQRKLILNTLRQNNNNYSRTARQLGISRTTLWRRMKKFKIEGILLDK